MIEMYFDFRLFRLWKTRQHSKLLDYDDLLWCHQLLAVIVRQLLYGDRAFGWKALQEAPRPALRQSWSQE